LRGTGTFFEKILAQYIVQLIRALILSAC
jgi:hypothetical protein